MVGPTSDRQAHGWPDVDVVVATRDRRELLHRCLTAIRAQDYPGNVAVRVVFDGVPADRSLELDEKGRSVRVMTNERSPGLAGSRNTGILAGSSPLVAFCDDDDVWLPYKLTEQVEALEKAPDAFLASCSIRVRYADALTVRRVGRESVEFSDLLASRMMELHPSTFVMRRSGLEDGVGLVSEDVPGSYAEDYEFLLRAARHGRIVVVDSVGAEILWHRQSYFFSRWQTIVDGLTWLLQEYPEFSSVPRGYARIAGQIAFAHAACRNRRAAASWAWRGIAAWPREPRPYLALAVAAQLVGAEALQRRLHRRGRGI